MLAAAGCVAAQAEPFGVTAALDRIKRGEPIRLGYRTNSPPLSFARDGVAKGTTNLRSLTRFAADRALKLSVIETIDTKAAFTAVSRGTASAAALNEISAMGWLRAQPQAAVRLLDRYLSTEPVAVSLPKHDLEFVRVFSGALADLMISAEAARIYQRWLGSAGLGLPLNQLTREAFRVPIVFSVPGELL